MNFPAQIDPVWWVLGALGLLVIVLGIALLSVRRQLRESQAELDGLIAQFSALREQSQRDLLAMGQRVMEADKVVRRFSERLDAIADAPSAPTQYGQLESLLANVALNESGGKMSTAEEQLLSLLRRSTSGK
jgi:hypothetical protein